MSQITQNHPDLVEWTAEWTVEWTVEWTAELTVDSADVDADNNNYNDNSFQFIYFCSMRLNIYQTIFGLRTASLEQSVRFDATAFWNS